MNIIKLIKSIASGIYAIFKSTGTPDRARPQEDELCTDACPFRTFKDE